MLLFVADLSQRVTYGTARSYLSAIRHGHLSRGLPDPLVGKVRLDLALKGLKRQRPVRKDKRMPITPSILEVIGQSLVKHASKYDRLLIWAACCIGFFAFMRSGEVTVPEGARFDPTMHLTPRDVAVDSLQEPTMIRIRLKISKTDQARQGIELFVGRTFNSLCPVIAMLKYLEVRGVDDGPLFRRSDGSPLHRDMLVSQVKLALEQAGLDPSHYAGHSFRIGAATTAAACGLSDATIQMLGRWKSDSFMRYIRTPRQELAALSRRLAT